jgi:hypothetical protein
MELLKNDALLTAGKLAHKAKTAHLKVFIYYFSGAKT